ncbi:purine and uridine phosphorylase, partial [Aureobasidium melanogenum]
MEKILEKTSLPTSRESVAGDRLLTFDEIAPWQKDSPHIYTGYRPLTGSWSQSIKSIFRWHNETINIHSHSVGSIIFAIILPLHFYFALYRNVPAAQPIDATVFLLYFAGVASCFAVSAAFHTAGSHSQAVHKKYNRADCCGIVLLMWGASLASIHFAFICDARLKSLHWFLSSASATGCITFILGPLFIQPAYRNLRALTYLSLGLFAIVFILHGIYLHGFALQRRRLSLEWMGLMALLNFLGCAAYAFRIPESKFPVWTYYESVASEYEREERFLRSDRVHSEIFCPSENTKLQASPYRTSILDLDHDDVCDIFSYRKLHSKQFLEDLREMVDTLRSSKFGVSSGVSQTGKRERAARESVFVMVPETYDGSTSSANDRFPKHAGKPHVNNKSNELSTSDSPQNGGLAPAIMDYKFGWICALSFEAAAAEVMLDEQYPDLPLNDRDSTLYRLGRIERHNVVIACLPRGRPGLSAATAVARDMLEKFRGIRFGFMVGIGGGVPSVRDDIRLGDVVVSQPNLEHGGIVQYDFGKAEEGGRFRRIGHLNSPPTLLLSVLNRVQINHERGRRMYPSHMGRYAKEDMEEYTHPHNERDVLFNATYPHTGEFDCKNCDPDQIVDRPERKSKNTTAKIHYGTIASGNQVIKDAQTRDRIVRDLGGQVLCFEMEAAGLMNDLPCLVIRGISDYCDSHKNDGWQKYAAASAAAYTRELLLSIPSGDVVG